MKINRISIKNLFGIFNHEIPLNTKDHITIIHGPNGYGKTILLTLMNAIFNSQYHELRRIPFSGLSINFDDNSILSLKKNNDLHAKERKNSKNGNSITFEFSKQSGKQKSFPIETLDHYDLPFPLGIIESKIPGIIRISRFNWRYLPTQEELSLEDILERFGNRLSRLFPFAVDVKAKKEPSWLRKIKNSININFIEAQRLLTSSGSSSRSRLKNEYDEHPSMIPAVNKYSEELAEAIQSKLSEYGSLSHSLDRTFPTRLVKGKPLIEPTIDELKKELNELEEKRSQLMAAGLLDKGKEIDFKDLQKIDKSNINVLSVYIRDVKNKLSVFDELTDKIDLMVKIINNRFLFKKLSMSKKEGFVLKTTSGKSLPLTRLSSGEQHELVLLYELLFKVKPDSLILIDEPELSLHVVWQQQFLKDLQEITTLVGFDVLIATHSPQIINDRWDLTVELEGPKK